MSDNNNKKAKLKRTAAGILVAAMCIAPAATAIANAESTTDASSSSSSSQSAPGGTPPSGSAPSGGAAPDGQSQGGGTPPDASSQSGTAPSGGGANTMAYDYAGTLSGALTADGEEVSCDGESYSATEADQNAALAESGGTLTITSGTFDKSGDDTNGDNCNFYGINSIILGVGDSSKIYISDSTLNSSSEGSNAIFATDGATVYANNDKITTSSGNSRGLDATYDGTIIANNMDIATQGDHCASIATDRGGGNISVTNSTLSTAGSGSPLLYSTGDIQVDNVSGTATGSQIAGMEGLNTILIYNSTLESTLTEATASDPIADGIIIYQSTSGDADSTTGETASFESSNSTLKSAIESGAMFYITNTNANVVLSGTTLDFDSDKANLLTIAGNDSNNWGTAGSNGGDVTFTGLGETLNGNIDVDTISTLRLYLLQGTTYTGAISISDNAVNTDASDAPVTVNVDADSTWIVTGNSTVTNLNAAEGATIADDSGKAVTIVANGQTVVNGDSDYTITVTGTYSNDVTTDESNALSTDYIDRADFDSYYATSTAFSTNASAVLTDNVSSDSADTQSQTSHTPIYVAVAIAIVAVCAGIFGVSKRKPDKGSDK